MAELPDFKIDNLFNRLISKENRIGKFFISDECIKIGLSRLMDFMSKVFIVRAEHLKYKKCFEYIGYSELFNSIDVEKEPPEYIICFENDNGKEITNVILKDKIESGEKLFK